MKELEHWLNRYINDTEVDHGGNGYGVYFIKQQLAVVRNMKIEMYSNDHNPPHFHVKSACGTVDAVFGLYDCAFIEGTIDGKDRKRIEAFYQQIKPKLINFWEEKVIKQPR